MRNDFAFSEYIVPKKTSHHSHIFLAPPTHPPIHPHNLRFGFLNHRSYSFCFTGRLCWWPRGPKMEEAVDLHCSLENMLWCYSYYFWRDSLNKILHKDSRLPLLHQVIVLDSTTVKQRTQKPIEYIYMIYVNIYTHIVEHNKYTCMLQRVSQPIFSFPVLDLPTSSSPPLVE